MASVTVTLSHICSGGNHLTFSLTGAKTGDVMLSLDELTDPITKEDVEAFIRVIGRLAKAGRTNAQARTVLQSGVTVTA